MKIFPSEAVRIIDQYTIDNEAIKSIDLMERAASRLVNWYLRRYRTHRKLIVIAGSGNNGGDALAVARILAERQYNVECYLLSSSGKLSEDCKVNLERLKQRAKAKFFLIKENEDFPEIASSDILLDGLFGSGLTRVLEGIYKELVEYINSAGVEVLSIDIPSGLFGEDNSNNDSSSIIQAKHTLSFQFPFLSFFFAENEKYTGQWHILDIGLHKDIISQTSCAYSIIEKNDVAIAIPERAKFSHKGTYGHALVIAGSHGMMGAAILTGKSVLRTGAGLVSMHIPAKGYEIVQTAFPEAIASIDVDDKVFTEAPDPGKYSALAIGPGLGAHEKTKSALAQLLQNAKIPLLIDADALNIISDDKSLIRLLPEGTILTPHPLEFDRIAGSSENAWQRHVRQIEFSVENRLIVVLKGAYTGISFPDGTYMFNTTGNAGMATGGSGDVLSGIIVSLLAQGLKAEDAAIAGVFIHGVAGDIASEKYGQESMIAGDIIKCLGAAFKYIKEKPFLHEGRTGGVIQ